MINKIVRWTDEITNKIKFKTDFGIVDFTEEQIIFINQFICMVEDKKTQAVKEFAEKVKAHAERCYEWDMAKIVKAEVDNVLKEYEK